MSKLAKLWDEARDSEAFQQVRAKYDELDNQTKLYVNLGALASVVLLVFLTILISMARLSSLKSEIEDKEELIGYLQGSSDTIRQLKAQQSSSRGMGDASSPLPQFVDTVLMTSGVDRGKVDVGTEKPGTDDKEVHETLLEVKMNQVNLRQIVRLMFNLTEQGKTRALNIKDLVIDTKSDPSGYMDASFTIAGYKAK